MDIALPNLIRDRDRHGNVRYYVRVYGKQKIRLKELPGSADFLRKYEEAIETLKFEVVADANGESISGSFGWLVDEFLKSPAATSLAENTQRNLKSCLNGCTREKLKSGARYAVLPANKFTRDHLLKLRDLKVETPASANERIQMVGKLFSWGRKERRAWVNLLDPTVDVDPIPYERVSHRAWTPAEVGKFQEAYPLGTREHLALSLFMFTGQRRSDVHRFGPQHIVEEEVQTDDGPCKEYYLQFTPKKTRKTTGEMVLPILPLLMAVLKDSPVGQGAFVVKEDGEPYGSADSVGRWLHDQARKAGLPEDCTSHGLRTTGAEIALENGATEKQMMAIFGWSSAKMVYHYGKKANQKKLAKSAMSMLVVPTSPTFLVPLVPPAEKPN